MSKFRDGLPVTGEAVTLVLSSIDRIKDILGELESHEREPDGADTDLIGRLEQMAQQPGAKAAARAPVEQTVGTLVPPTPGRPLRPGEVSLDELERVFRDTPGPVPVASQSDKPRNAGAASDKDDAEPTVASKSIRVSVGALENLMTMVSELVLTRNQLLDIVRRHDESEFKVPLQ